MNLSLKNKTALVCGSTQGIGKAAAIELANMGANVILLARSEDKLKDSLKDLDASNGQNHSYLVADFAQPNDLKKTITDFVNAGNKIHVLVNNTGGPKGGTIKDAATDEFLSGATNTARLQSIVEVKAQQHNETIDDVFEEMASESPMKRIAQPEEVAAAIAFLASPAASYINGINVPVDGGRTKSL